MEASKNSKAKLTVRPKKTTSASSRRIVLEQLATELYCVVRLALSEFGLSVADQQRLIHRSKGESRGTPVSNDVLRRFTELGDLIAAWHRDTEYLDIDGKPRILAIKGRGATFETLAKRFLPGMSTSDSVKLACRTAEVGLLGSGKIALYGSTLVKISKNAESALAQCVCHIAWLSQTCVKNFNATQNERTSGRIERITGRIISASDFEAFQKQIRPQIHDLCERVDGMLLPLERRASRLRKNQRPVGMGIYLYADDNFVKPRRPSSRQT
jgi:hypothetical protein